MCSSDLDFENFHDPPNAINIGIFCLKSTRKQLFYMFKAKIRLSFFWDFEISHDPPNAINIGIFCLKSPGKQLFYTFQAKIRLFHFSGIDFF